jgi:4-amino-4-deoxy-L-arabinose transferase-like glycosyltransferase
MTSARAARLPLALAVVAVVAALARLGTALLVWGTLPEGFLLNADCAEYHRQALILAGLAPGSLPEVFGLSPLTVAWGGLWHALLGPGVWAVIGPQIVLGTGTAVVTAVAARRLGGDLAGWVAGLLAALLGPLIFYDIAILAEPLAAFLAAATALAFLRMGERPVASRVALPGLLLGLLIACRPNSALLLPAGLVLVIAASRRAGDGHRRNPALAAALFVAAALLPVVPVAAFNTARSGAFVPLTAGAGMNLFLGNNQGASGRLEPVFGARTADELYRAFEQRAEAAVGRELDPAEISRFWTAAAWREVADDPARFARLLGRKAVYASNDFEVPDNWDIPFIGGRLPLPVHLLPGFGVLFPLGALGLILLWRRGPPGSRMLHAVAGAAFLTMLLFFVSGRYRAPALPILAVASGYALAWLGSLARTLLAGESGPRRRAARALMLAALALALLSVLAHLPVLHPRHDLERQRLESFSARGEERFVNPPASWQPSE